MKLRGAAFFAATGALAHVPWTVRYWPAQDDPNHLAILQNAQRLRASVPAFSQYFELTWSLKPHNLTYWLIGQVSKFTDLITAAMTGMVGLMTSPRLLA
jgi:hypothetical protein